jgi:hypothetical protein
MWQVMCHRPLLQRKRLHWWNEAGCFQNWLLEMAMLTLVTQSMDGLQRQQTQ